MGRVVCSSVQYIPETTDCILIKLNIGNLQQKLPGEFNFYSYQTSVTPTLHEAQIRFYLFSQKWLMV